MLSRIAFAKRSFDCVLILLTVLLPVSGQQSDQQTQPSSDETQVLRITSELVQASVTVFDKQGRFVEGLKPEQFEVRLDGKPATLSFFEFVTAGTIGEEKQITAASRAANNPGSVAIPEESSYRGRTIIFFIDDLHLSAVSVERTRKTILEFIGNQMGPDDQVAIASASGQIGFLQTFTEVKAVLRAAVARLHHRPYTVRDAENVPMTEYQALRIEQGDKDAIDYFVAELMKATRFNVRGGGQGPPSGGPAASTSSSSGSGAIPNGMSPLMAERVVKERALVLLKQSASVTTNTLATLESLMRSSSQMTGRKLVFFISDGFYLNDRNTGFGEKLKQITDAAIRSGVVIYTMDARGMVSLTDASSNRSDPMGRLSRTNIGELSASQDPLTALAGDTGGRALLNSDTLNTAVTNALKETSNYYLLAWRPPMEEQKGGNFKRIAVSVIGRPDLTVRLPRGFLLGGSKTSNATEAATANNKTAAASPTKGTEAALIAALGAPSARKGLPTQLFVSFLDMPGSGPVLTASMQMATDVLDYGPDGKQTAAIDIAGVVLNDQGKQAGRFKTRVNVNPLRPEVTPGLHPGVIYGNKLPLKPGIYEVRVAVRDSRSGRVGSAARWIEIPDLTAKHLTLSTPLIGTFGATNAKQAGGGDPPQFMPSVDRRFARSSHLSLLSVVYNAARGNSAPDLEARIMILRNGQTILTSPVRKIITDANTDLERIVYGSDIALQTLPPGRYLLRITISDRIAQTSASQETVFEVEQIFPTGI